MAKHKRKAPKSKPITSNPLFPAVVALWFGALFGLSSLAVRPSLLESLVIKSHLDLVVPAAAPPLGITARILLALLLAALGALIGATIARRIGRPKPVVRERKRGTVGEAVQIRARDAHPDAPARRPISAHDELDGEADEGPSILATRRRALAIEHEEDSFVPHEMAPLPGGQPQILDIAEMRAEMKIDSREALGTLDLGSFAEAEEPAPQVGQTFAPPAPAASQLDWSNARPVELDPNAPPPSLSRIARSFEAEPEDQRQMFHPSAQGSVEPQIDPAQANAMAGRQVFGMAPVAPEPVESRQVFGMQVEGDRVAPEVLREAGYQVSVFETPEPDPLFTQRQGDAPAASTIPQPASAFAPAAAPDPLFMAPHEASPAAAPAIPQAFEAQPAPQSPVFEPAPAASAPADAAPISGLGITDLAGRLADSMRRRRAARDAALAAPAPEPTFAAPTPAPQSFAAEPVAAPAAAVPPAYVPPLGAAPLPEGVNPVSFAAPAAPAPSPAPVPSAYEPEVQAPAPIPSAYQPEVSAPAPAAPFEAMPAAMRPLDFDLGADDEEALDSLLPPRRLGVPSFTPLSAEAMTPPTAEQPAAPQLAELPQAALDDEEVIEDAEIEEAGDNYGSLLDLGQTGGRNPFVRINEPEPAGEAIEPVVIFPGQAAQAASAAVPAPFGQTEAASEDSSFRRFDAPTSAGHGQPVAASALNPALDSDEAERALRAALANLQRMSGAA